MPKVQTLCALVVVLVLGVGFAHMLQQAQPMKTTTSEKPSQILVDRAMTIQAGLEPSVAPISAPTPPPAQPSVAPESGYREVTSLPLDPGDYGCDGQDVSYRIGPGSTPTSTRAMLVSDKNLIMGGYEFTCQGIGCTADYGGGLVATLVKTGPDTFELTELKFGAKTAHLCAKKN